MINRPRLIGRLGDVSLHIYFSIAISFALTLLLLRERQRLPGLKARDFRAETVKSASHHRAEQPKVVRFTQRLGVGAIGVVFNRALHECWQVFRCDAHGRQTGRQFKVAV